MLLLYLLITKRSAWAGGLTRTMRAHTTKPAMKVLRSRVFINSYPRDTRALPDIDWTSSAKNTNALSGFPSTGRVPLRRLPPVSGGGRAGTARDVFSAPDYRT